MYARKKTHGLLRQFFTKFVPNSIMFRSLIQNFTQNKTKDLKSKERNLFTSASVKCGFYCADFCDTYGRLVKFCGHLLCLILCTSEKNVESRAKFHVHVEVTCAFHCTDCYETRDLFHGTTWREVYRALSRSVQTEGRNQFTSPRNVLLSRRQI